MLFRSALALAAALQKRATRAGQPVPSAAVLGETGLAGELWDLVRRCREAGVDPEEELRRVSRAFRDSLQGDSTS